jgi:hypothetical protein
MRLYMASRQGVLSSIQQLVGPLLNTPLEFSTFRPAIILCLLLAKGHCVHST